MRPLPLKKPRVHAVRILFGLLFGLLLAAGGLAWLLGTESALRWSAQQAEQMSDGKLILGTVHGSLYGPLRIESITLRTDEQRFEVKEAKLDWTPRALFRRHVRIDRLTLQELRIVELKPSTEPVKLPASLRLPFSLSAPSIKLDRVVLAMGDTAHTLSAIDLGLNKQADSYKLSLHGISSEWGKAGGEILLGDAPPFTVAAHASLKQDEQTAYDATMDFSGNLTQLLLKGRVDVLSGQAKVDARIAPFETNPLVSAHIEAEGMNPALLRKDLPQAKLGAVISVERRDMDELEGKIALRNALPGAWDKARLPLREMAARFSGSAERLDLRAIHLDLAEAGDFKGDGQFKDGQLTLDLSTTNFNPQGAYGKIRRMQLAGGIRLRADDQAQQIDADLRYRRFQLHLDARRRGALVELHQASVRSSGGSLALHGTLALEGSRKFQLSGALKGFNPSDFGDYPAARINASLSATGNIATQPQATLEFALADSRFRDQPLSGRGKLSASPSRIWDSDVMLSLAGNRLEFKGALGSLGDRLGFAVEADKLALFDTRLAGQVHAKGALEGRFSAPSGNFDAKIDGLAWRKDFRIASLHGSGRLDQGIDGPLTLDVGLQGLVTPQLHLDQAALNARGSRAKHTLQVLAKNRDIDLDGRLAGGWRDDSGWSGQVTKLVNHGRRELALKSPASLEISAKSLRLRDARFAFAGADLALHELIYDAGQFTSSGELKALPLAYFLGYTAQTADLESDLTFGGDWRFAVGEKVDGHLTLRREHGDISLPTSPRTTLGLTLLALKMETSNNRLLGRLEANGTRLGNFRADAQVPLSRHSGAWGIAGDAPLQASADLTVASLSWLAPLLDRNGALSCDGALSAHLRADGPVAKPRLSGTLAGEHITVAQPEQGLRFTEGGFQAELRDQVLHLAKLTLRGGDGTLSGQGRLLLEGEVPVMRLLLKADKLEVLSRPDRHLVLSGTGEASVKGGRLRASAKLKADRGLIELPRGDAPTVSDDVIVLGRTGAEGRKSSPYTPNFDLDLDLGEQFFVKGMGLDAQLGGTLKLASVAGALPRSRGNIRVIKGAYSAYGQKLDIERGILNFQGPLDNPGLDILALRKNQPVEAGVAVSGTAQAPRVRLASKPSVPDSEILSWLVLGHGMEDSSAQEFSALQAAAGALLATGESVTLQQKIAHAAGLEEVSLKGGSGLEGTVLALGKRLSSRTYLSYEQGLGGAGSLVKINYTLSRRLSLRAQAGASPALDLFYTFSYD